MERLNHVQWLRRQKTYERNILAVFTRATAAEIVDGKAWYPYAIDTFARIDHTNLWTPSTRAAIAAILSPRITWKENVKNVQTIHRAVSQGLRVVPVMAGINANISKAYDVATGARGVDAVSGPKVSCFYANLCGDFQRVTLDIWAGRAAGMTDAQLNHGVRGKRYVYLERAYQNVARELGFLPAELQAIVWCVVRETGE